MINLGFNSGKNMPNVYLELTIIDRILEGVAVLAAVMIWVLAIIFYIDLGVSPSKLFILPATLTVFVALLLWGSRAPIRLYNFPVKLNDRNYVIQYLIASRFIRVLNVIGGLMFFFSFFLELEYLFHVTPGLFINLLHATLALTILSFVGYYILAFRNR